MKFLNIKNLEKPFDINFHDILSNISKKICQEIPYTVLSFISGDEIILILNPKKEIWCSGLCNKINSMVSGLASYYFVNNLNGSSLHGKINSLVLFQVKTITNLDIEDTINYLIWKQDSSRKNYNQHLGTLVLKVDSIISSEKLNKDILKKKFEFSSDFIFKTQKSYLNKILS